ncbi:DUF3800 domain-containing protein [Novosphingobium pokkalii]|uniref:DUF3800 domain-containing protein n=1 Tax=Novosphingobium pokkalii TaxID=1770194 RepID=A0ABV7V5F9_9SPHN|nr:DUF3800 domain-containing protein [Novosphingobium pokkalii]GHD00834.1 hypothetical protein GCM10019060_34900 [Novosphingobium pokkalii]
MVDQMDIDVNGQRDPAIELYGLPVTDEARTLYYDETNNHRLVYLTDDGFNVPDPRFFVLGGVAHPGLKKAIDLSQLRRSMGIQPATPEIKFDMIAKGDFLKMLSSKKLNIFLNWLMDEAYLIHFIALDPVYYSYVDIVDSMPQIGMFNLVDRYILKRDLYRVLRRDLDTTQDILRRYSYPALTSGNVRGFLTEIVELVEDADDLMPHYNLMMLKGVLQSGRALSSLPLLDDTPGLIMENFSSLFMHRICLFKASQHILDNEDKVSKVLEKYRFMDAGEQLDFYRFVDSKLEPRVQLADVVVGLLSACLAWLREFDSEEIFEIKQGLTPAQNDNRLALSALVDRSIAVTDAFVQKAMSLDDMERLEHFLDR